MLSQTAARTLFGGANPIGRFVSTGKIFESKDALQVVGVAPTSASSIRAIRSASSSTSRSTQDPAPVTAVAGSRRFRSRAPGRRPSAPRSTKSTPRLLVGAIRPLDEIVEAKLSNEKLLALLSACFGVLALALTAVGVYGVIAYAVQRRTQEIGIRLALGAERAAVARMMMRDVALLAVRGHSCSAPRARSRPRAPCAPCSSPFAPADYSLLAAAAALLFLIAAAAGYLPARRAARLDPMDALRQE